ncbi:MAG: response regulator [Elusimicrobiota bacterium]
MNIKTYTTTEISRMCDVYPTTVINWINAGSLSAFVTPGGHRRVRREDLVQFLKKFNMPVPEDLMTGQKRVVIIDDDKEMLRLLERSFTKYPDSFSVDCFSDGVEALVHMGQQTPDLVILDIVMPKMDGLQVCERLKGIDDVSGVKIIAITGKRGIDEADLKKHGIDAICYKPFLFPEILQKATHLLRMESPGPKRLVK